MNTLSRPKPLGQSAAEPRPGDDRGLLFDAAAIPAILWRRRWQLVLIVVVALALTWVQVERTTPVYTTRTTIVIEPQETQIVDLQSVVPGVNATDLRMLNTQSQIITSRALLGRVVDRLRLTEDPLFNPALLPVPEPGPLDRAITWLRSLMPATSAALSADEDTGPQPQRSAQEVAVNRLAQAISVNPVDASMVLIVTAQSERPGLAAEIANAVGEVYIVDQLEAKFEATRQATAWLSDRVTELRTEVEASEEAIEAFRSRSSVVNPAALEVQAQRLKDLRDRLATLRNAADEGAEARDRLVAAREAGDLGAVAALAGGSAMRQLAAEIARGAAGDDADARFDALYETELRRIDTAVSNQTAQTALLENSIADLEALARVQSEDVVELRQLQREAEAVRALYEVLLQRRQELSVQEGLQSANARIISPAVRPMEPSSPKMGSSLLLSGLAATLLGSAALVVLDLRRRTFRSREELARETGRSVLGVVPASPVRRRAGMIGYLSDNPTSRFAEALRNVRTSLALSSIDRPPQVVLVTSSLPEEGKTTLSIGLACQSAAIGKRTLLIECDLRRPVLRRAFGAPRGQAGLIDVLSGETAVEDAIVRDPRSGLDVIVGQRDRASAADLLASQRFRDLLTDLRQRYDAIVIDTPPVLAVPDARVVGPMADTALFAVHWRSTPQSVVREALSQLEDPSLPPPGLVLSRANLAAISRYAYGGYDYHRRVGRYYR